MTECPKCRATSGDDWSRCNGKCPMEMSPHFDQAIAEKFNLADQLGVDDPQSNLLAFLYNLPVELSEADHAEIAVALLSAYEIKPKKRND